MPLIQPVIAVLAPQRFSIVAESPVGQVEPDFFIASVVYAYGDEALLAEYRDHFQREAARFIKRHDLMRRTWGKLDVNVLVTDR